MQSSKDEILKLKNISISFPGVKALSGVDFRLMKGEVHALMGENGAGKSTLIKIMTGVYKQNSGNIYFEDKLIKPESPQHAQKLGISTVYQEVNLCSNLSVAENIFIGREPLKFGMINWKEINTKSYELLKNKLEIDIDVTQELSSYSIAIQQMVAIARALDISSKVLILDEPTSSLDDNEVKQLFSVIKKLKNEGMAILFVTHFLDQTYEISDRITVLRNGELVGEYEINSLPKLELIRKMIGKEYVELEQIPKEKIDPAKKLQKETILRVENFGRAGYINPFDLEINKGETVGLAGLLGSGRTEIAKLIFGIEKSNQGNYYFKNKKIFINSPRNAIGQNMGLCPENRKLEGIIDELSVRENIILALQGRRGWFRFISRKKQETIADQYIKLLNISTPDSNQLIKNLSGGNQQKVILARWLATNPEFLILDEPTRGIDVGAKAEIQKIIMSLCQKGMAILFISSELDEVIRCSNRIMIMKDRIKIAELNGDEIDETAILRTIAKGEKTC
jgi:galactofuranose transport system ATP-binding protein